MKEVDFELLKQLISLVEKRIKVINKSISDSIEEIERTNEYDKIIALIKEDELCFAFSSFIERISKLLSVLKLDNKEELTLLLEHINYLGLIANSIKRGNYASYNKSEKEMIEFVVNLLNKFKEIAVAQNVEYDNRVIKSNEELEKLNELYDKLRKGKDGVEHFDNDIDYILELIDEYDVQFKKNVLTLIQALSKCIHDNINKKIDEMIVPVDEDLTQEDEIDQEEINYDVIKGVFEKYGFNFDVFTEKHRDILASKRSLKRIEEILSVLASSEYSFVKNYEKSNELKLFHIFRYSSKEILEYLVSDTKKRGVTLEEVFCVRGVFKKISKTTEPTGTGPGGDNNEDYIAGSYEYYKENALFFEKLTKEYQSKYPDKAVDFFKMVLLKAPSLLTSNPEHIKSNYRRMIQYNLNYAALPKAYLALGSPNFLQLLDVLIENDMYDYAQKYLSVLSNEFFVKTIIYEKRAGRLERDNHGRILHIRNNLEKYDKNEVNSVVNNNHIRSFFSNIELPEEFNQVVLSNENNYNDIVKDVDIQEFESREGVNLKDNISYDIKGVTVSRLKVLRVYGAIKQLGLFEKYDKNQMLLYALTYNSYYSLEEFEILRRFVYEHDLGGNPGGVFN